MLRWTPIPLGLLAMSALLGCSLPRVVGMPDATYEPAMFAASAGAAPVAVIVLGEPFGADGGAFADRLVAALPSPGFAETQYRRAPASEAGGGRLVFVAGGRPTSALADTLCEAPQAVPPQPAAAGELHLFGVFCQGSRPRSQVTGVTGAAGPEDRRITQLAQAALLELLPTKAADQGGADRLIP